MANIDKVSVKNTVYNIVSPAVVSDYIEVIGGACTKPDGYEEDEVILAKQNDVQLLFKATQDIAFGANIVENTNCVRTTLEEVLKSSGGGGGASSADQVSYDNSDSGLEAENVQEAVDELATNAGTASSQIQTLTNETYNVNDTAITEVASDDLLPIYDTSATGKKKIAVSNFIGGLVSNPNLLDNPWFTVNQRGAISYGDKADTTDSHLYTVDRWIVRKGQLDIQADGSVRVYGNLNTGIGNHAQLNQSVNNKDSLIGKTVTLSVKIKSLNTSDASHVNLFFAGSTVNYGVSTHVLTNSITKGAGIHTFTFTVPSDFTEAFMNVGLYLGYDNASDISNEHYIDVEAIKLELGSVSTLVNDIAPNYATELLKCQRYFQCLRGSIGMGFFKVADKAECVCPIPVPMRATPTATITNNVGVVAADGYSAYATGITLWGEFPDSCVGFDLNGFSHAADGSVCRLFTNNGGSINLSADL